MKALMGYFREILFLLGGDKSKLPWMVFLFLMVSLLDAIGIGMMGPYISLIIDPISEESKIFKDFVSAIGVSSEGTMLLIVISSALIGLFFIKGLAGVFILRMIVSFSYKQQVRLRSHLMHTYQSMQYVEYINRNSAEYIYAIQDLVSIFTGKILMLGLKTLSDILMAITIIAVLAWTNIELLSVLLLMISIIAVIYDQLIRKSIQVYGKEANIASTKMLKGVKEGILGMKELRVLGKSRYFHGVVYKEAAEYADKLKKTEVLTNIPRYLIEFMMIGFLCLMVIFELLSEGNVDQILPTLAMFAVASLKLVPSISSISTGIIQLRFNRNTVSLLYKDLKCFEKYNSTDVDYQNDEVFDKLTLKSINFNYPNTTKSIINNINFSIEKKDTIGIIGLSGSGKTTLIDIILGLLKPQEGEISLNGKKINDHMDVWQKQVAYLPQQVFIIDDSLRNNIALGVHPLEINEERIHEALERSRLKEVVEQLSKGLDTRLGENGISLSGGQRQRVSLARAIYHGKKVMIMDEATSALDEATEKEVANEIRSLKGDVTMIIIAHRYNTLKYCDRIYRLDKGSIVEETTYEKLINN